MAKRTPDGSQTDLFRSTPAPAPAPGEPAVALPRLPDRAARERIATDLDANLLVEAGAGAGKTTEMVNRMLALVAAGEPVERIAAVTFTRKAAAELRERFQNALEERLRTTSTDEERERYDAALRSIDRAFLGTIHAFCARLLRERPLEAGLDPGFREVFGPDQVRLQRRFWTAFVERAAAAGDEALAALRNVALSPAQIRPIFELIVENPDVTFPADPVPQPDASAVRARLEEILDGAQVVPREEPEKGWDRLQDYVRKLRFHRRMGWSDDVVFLDVLARVFVSTPKIETKKRYNDLPGGWQAAAPTERALQELMAEDGPGGRALAEWRAHRYPIAIACARAAADAFAAERARNGTLFFVDLLVRAAALLRGNDGARAELGEGYRRLLVDEFQDTDPLQAEVLLLLASDPGDGSEWRTAVPRPGALFVVGDPKQSIYRFRRADIALYGRVRDRFQQFGAVLELVSNFRSRPAIEQFVNRVFDGRFPERATPAQAAFAPMRAQREASDTSGVFSYRLAAAHRRQEQGAAEDADRIATWIADRIANGERNAGDFLVLTRTRKFLAVYAQALEARNIPMQVTGAGLGIETELSELRLLLEALADPADATRTLAVLTGLFFGLDYEALAEHVLDRGGRISFTSTEAEPGTAVERALSQLHDWWRLSRREPADVVVGRIVDAQGLLPWAAGGPLGESRAGALQYVLDAVRKASLDGDATLAGAVAAIDAALESEEAEAPLEPGRTDVLRLMNLHQAKGLEAPVVVLAGPYGNWTPDVKNVIERLEDGSARGWTQLSDQKPGWSRGLNVHAAPLVWEEVAAAEAQFEAAEEDRLLYVACTRAGDELIVARPNAGGKDADAPWATLYPALDEEPVLDLPLRPPPARTRVDRTTEEVRSAIARADARRTRAAAPTHRFGAVTGRVKVDEIPSPTTHDPDAPRGRGTGWGTAVHGALEAIARGASGDRLRAIARGLLVSAERPLDPDGTPVELEELVELVHAVATSDLWKRAGRAARNGHLLVETPFALALPSSAFTDFMRRAGAPAKALEDPAPIEVIEGVIDLAFRADDAWVLADYKSDAAGHGIEAWRRARYRAQLGLYAAAWEHITGEEVRERVLFYTATGETESW